MVATLQSPTFMQITPTMPTTPINTHPIPLRPYQQEGVEFLHKMGRGGFITDQPGLGKTETAIAACLDPNTFSNNETGPTPIGKVIICCPSFLGDQWFDRILQYLPKARVVLVSGARSARQKALRLDADWYIINYEMLHQRTSTDQDKRRLNQQDTKKLRTAREPFTFPNASIWIFDESHNLKNPNGKQAQAAQEMVADPSIHVILLSGTPIKKDPDDLYMQCKILAPHEGYLNPPNEDLYFPYYEQFVRRYCVNLPSAYGNRVIGARKKPIQDLMDKVAHFTSYEQAGVYRPEVQPTRIRVTLDDKYKDAYNEIARMYAYMDIRMYSAIEVMHALRIVTASSPAKYSAAINLAEQFPQCMFFTYYVGSARNLAAALTEKLGVHVPYIAGSQETNKTERARILESTPPYLVGTLGSLSVGINNLMYMKAVVFFEEDWTPDVIEQATDRVRRFGNKAEKIFTYHLNARGTIDEVIHEVMNRRGATAEMIVRRTFEAYRKEHPQYVPEGVLLK